MNKPPPKVLLLAEDQQFAQRLVQLIEDELHLYDIDRCLSLAQAVELLAMPGYQPDLVLIDMLLPDSDGIAATVLLKKRHPELSTYLVLNSLDIEQILRAIQTQANGYLYKEELSFKELSTHENFVKLSPPIFNRLVRYLKCFDITPCHVDWSLLTKREMEIVDLLTQGNSLQHISENILFISYETSRKHIQNIYKKLHLNNQRKLIDAYKQR